MPSVIWLLFWPLFVSFVFACVFYVLRDEAEVPRGLVPNGRHFQIRQNRPEHAPRWFGRKSLWLLIVFMLLVYLKFPGGGDESNVCTPRGHQGCSSGSAGRKMIKASPCKDSKCGALTQFKTELANLVSRMGNLKLTAAPGDKRQRLADTKNNITIYEEWDIGYLDAVDISIEEEEE
ncbi:protein FAM209-like [Moschus berezovskii]|uniref:protein FAM209-like n=1 Tax=Moschus berezovskii TaxID=68408 RepID=UPI002444C491|nr:protein FAM209-like [Moschus berezovskii]XP_055294755.1 protein FAM209-like [Moschus berezovskii]